VGGGEVGGVGVEGGGGGGVVRGRDHDPVGQLVRAAAVVHQDGPRDHRRRGHPVVALDDRLHPVGRENLQRRPLGRAGQTVCVLAHENRAVCPSPAAVVADGLGDRQDVRLGEGAFHGRPAVTAGAEADELV